MLTDLIQSYPDGGVEHTVREIAQQPALWREVGSNSTTITMPASRGPASL